MISIASAQTELTPDKVFSSNETVVAVLANIYARFNQLIAGNLMPALSMYADELTTTSSDPDDIQFAVSIITPANNKNLNIWKEFYAVIYQCNDVLEKLPPAVEISSDLKKQATGEALFLRAYAYNFLVQLYGKVPLILTTNVKTTAVAERAATEQIYTWIIDDLESAIINLPESYPSEDRVRVNRYAAVALLAKVQLLKKNWAEAERLASIVIESGYYSINPDLTAVFRQGSPETIFQFWTENGFTIPGILFIPGQDLLPSFPLGEYALADFLNGDKRKSAWLDSVSIEGEVYYYPGKYKKRLPDGNTEYLIALRLSELYLIRSEALARQDKITDAVNDLKIVYARSHDQSLQNIFTKEDCLYVIEKERRIEFFGEWGERFFDLKRNDRLNTVMPLIKPGWKSTVSVLPVPQYERLNNVNLSQNEGY